MDLGILSTQLEKLPASGLTLELKGANIFRGCFALSQVLSLVTLFFFVLLFCALYLLPLLWWQFFCLAMVLVCYCQHLFRKHFLLNHPYSIKKLVFTELDWCYAELNNSQIFKADIDPDTILTEHLVILNLTKRNFKEPFFNEAAASSFFSRLRNFRIFNHHSVFLTADRLDSKKFREIKRYLRLISFSKTSEVNVEETEQEAINDINIDKFKV